MAMAKITIIAICFIFMIRIYAFDTLIVRDFDGHPVDIPDIGAYEYCAPTALGDVEFYITRNWLSDSGNGDFNRDGICDLIDYAILIDWWDNRNGTTRTANKRFAWQKR